MRYWPVIFFIELKAASEQVRRHPGGGGACEARCPYYGFRSHVRNTSIFNAARRGPGQRDER